MMKVVELIREFDKFVTGNPRNKHNKYISFRVMHKFIEPLEDLEWDEPNKRV